MFEGRSLWHVNSTSTSGGVAELLASTLAYDAGSGIGVDTPGPLAFLRGDVDAASLCVFSRADYVWEDLRPPTVVMAPCVDVLSVKNRPLDPGERDAILAASGIVSSGASRRSANG